MTLLAQMDGCTMLGIGPKTLRNWLRHAKMQFSTHPTDARLKCLTLEQVQQLATLHARPLQMSPHYNRTCLERACPKELLKRNGSVYQSEVISDCSEAATCSKRAIVRRSVVPRERLWERPWKVR